MKKKMEKLMFINAVGSLLAVFIIGILYSGIFALIVAFLIISLATYISNILAEFIDIPEWAKKEEK